MKKFFKFRIYPNKTQEERLNTNQSNLKIWVKGDAK